jgi:pheromone shutdown protein TraB
VVVVLATMHIQRQGQAVQAAVAQVAQDHLQVELLVLRVQQILAVAQAAVDITAQQAQEAMVHQAVAA